MLVWRALKGLVLFFFIEAFVDSDYKFIFCMWVLIVMNFGVIVCE